MNEERIAEEIKQAWKIKKAWNKVFKRRKIKKRIEFLLVFLFLFFISYFGLTFEAQIVRLRYFWQHWGKKSEEGQFNVPKNSDLSLPKIQETVSVPNPAIKIDKYSLKNLQNNHLLIPKINVDAPIIWNSEVDENTMLANLQKGVVHYQGTALPDEKGNVFITGHSSYYAWDKGKYKTVFALLPKLEKGDQIALAYQNKVYVYEVYEKIVVKPTDTWVLQSTGEPMLSLMTCVPLGTNLNRLIVRAKPVPLVLETIKKPHPRLEELPPLLFPK